MKRPFGIAGGIIETLDHAVVKLHASTGSVGYGEGIPLPAYSEETQEEICLAIKSFLKNSVINEDPADIERIARKMDGAIPGHNYAKAALEFALWALIGKEFRVPVYKWCGPL
jgi:L-alanine-DL-glutamate epimerase-like enolase superfamily enzyme